MSVFKLLEEKVKIAPKKIRIVFPEGDDERILMAANRLAAAQIIEPILLGKVNELKQSARQLGLDLSGVTLVEPEADAEMITAFIAARGRELERQQVHEQLQDANYFATMLVKMGKADGMVSGAAHSTAQTVRPALQLIKTAKGMHRVSGSFIMERGSKKYLFADCAINIEPDSATLAEIAEQSVQTAKMINLTPKVAFLSFSTKGSAQGEMVDRVAEAAKLFKQKCPSIPADGELQFDAAFVPAVAKQKAPDSPLNGQANIFIFPELQSGNLAYKIAQRLGNFGAVGPILQGLAQPVNDLSRGASSQDVYDLAILTAAQVLEKNGRG
ncbi:phosphate acetyltransferase [Lactobacillus sp. ESL0681]|uniref:phosphate acetyltransferase n=1 Tax=Lactobacillus sp. ESL0681 TaxID=2983211 RepID=UPI0023F87656|nr:phosphate acetyltransferase [Lactobacillus sp. ESL0681]WEV40473.1 phosphate acetyltransferase [Lactobacillus sp. ESL0681]